MSKKKQFYFSLAFFVFALGFCVIRQISYYSSEDKPLRDNSVHQERADKLVKTLEKESLDNSIVLLNEQTQYFYPGVLSGEFLTGMLFEELLSARRVQKVLSGIDDIKKQDGQNEAAGKCSEIFEQTFNRYKNTIEMGLRQYEVPNAPPNETSIRSQLDAVCASMLCFAQIGCTDKVVEKLDVIDSYLVGLEKRIKGNISVFPENFWQSIQFHVRPDNHYILNVLLYSCSKSNSKKLKNVIKSLDIPKQKKVKLTNWDSNVGTYDLTHQLEGKPIQESDIREVIVVYNWPRSAKHNLQQQKKILHKLIDLLKK